MRPPRHGKSPHQLAPSLQVTTPWAKPQRKSIPRFVASPPRPILPRNHAHIHVDDICHNGLPWRGSDPTRNEHTLVAGQTPDGPL